MSATVTDQDRTNAVADVYERWRQAWLSQPVGTGMKELWDQEYDGLAYQSEENPDPMFAWKDIDAYWSWVPSVVKEIHEFETTARQISFCGDVALVFATARVVMDIEGVPELFIGDPVRVSIGLHEVDGQWKLIHYHESRMLNLQRELGLTSF